MPTPQNNRPRSNVSDDFDVNIAIEQHTESISGLVTRITALEDNFSTHEKIAETLCVTADTATKFSDMLGKVFIKQLSGDDETIKAVTKVVDKADRDQFKVWVKKIGAIIGAIILALISGGVGYFIHH